MVEDDTGGAEAPAVRSFSPESLRSGPLDPPTDHRQSPVPSPPAAVDRSKIRRALEVIERDSAAIAESYTSLSSSLRSALSEVTSTSVENMQCFGDVVGHLQESALDTATKGNRFINSCLRLNEEMKGIEILAMQLYPSIFSQYSGRRSAMSF